MILLSLNKNCGNVSYLMSIMPEYLVIQADFGLEHVFCGCLFAVGFAAYTAYHYLLGRNAPPPQVPGPDHIMDQLDANAGDEIAQIAINTAVQGGQGVQAIGSLVNVACTSFCNIGSAI